MRPASEAADVRAAYRYCEEITWSQARNFSYGIRLLPPAKRQALAAVYAFARRIDDIGDGDLPGPAKLTALAAARASVTGLGSSGTPATGGSGSDLVLLALADAAGRFDLPLAAFGELIDGCEADVRGTTYRTFDDLLHYCRCVAGSIGRLSLGVFGTADVATAAPLADALGVALQLTNILRDIREDYLVGRIYLPAEDFERFGCALDNGSIQPGPAPAGRGNGANGAGPGNGPNADPPGNGAVADQPGDGANGDKLVALVEFEAQRASTWYAKGLTLMPLLDWRSAASAGAMAGIYFRLLERIAATPQVVLERRMSLSAREKALVAARSLTMARRPRGAAGTAGTAVRGAAR